MAYRASEGIHLASDFVPRTGRASDLPLSRAILPPNEHNSPSSLQSMSSQSLPNRRRLSMPTDNARQERFLDQVDRGIRAQGQAGTGAEASAKSTDGLSTTGTFVLLICLIAANAWRICPAVTESRGWRSWAALQEETPVWKAIYSDAP